MRCHRHFSVHSFLPSVRIRSLGLTSLLHVFRLVETVTRQTGPGTAVGPGFVNFGPGIGDVIVPYVCETLESLMGTERALAWGLDGNSRPGRRAAGHIALFGSRCFGF
jgi:hypothetical protein